MGEKADLRAALDAARRSVISETNKTRRAEDEVRRLRSDVATLTDRLEDTHRRLQDQRAFHDSVAQLAAIALRLATLPPTGADQQEGTTT